VRRHLQRPGRRLHGPAGEERLDPPVARRLLAGAPRGHPAADRGELPALRIVPEGQVPGAQGGLEVRPGRAGPERRQQARVVERPQPRQVRHRDGHPRRTVSRGRHSADDARAAPVWHHTGSHGRGPRQQLPDLGPVVREGDAIRDRAKPSRAKCHPVGEALAPRVADPRLWVVHDEAVAGQAACQDSGEHIRQGRVAPRRCRPNHALDRGGPAGRELVDDRLVAPAVPASYEEMMRSCGSARRVPFGRMPRSVRRPGPDARVGSKGARPVHFP